MHTATRPANERSARRESRNRRRRNHTFAYPNFVGFTADRNIKFENEGRSEQPSKIVEPRAPFEAQLEQRLKKST
jgi:hypothetical protein